MQAYYSVDGPPNVYYIPNFVTEEEEAYLLRQIENSPKPKWKNLANRRLQVWGGDLLTVNKLYPQALPLFLTEYPDIIPRLRATGIFAKARHGEPNHVIVNEYLPGQGIMAHEDGPSYHPVVATISLGSHTVFHYYRYKSSTPEQETAALASELVYDKSGEKYEHKERGRSIDPQPVLSLLLERRSLVITASELYEHHLHGINAVDEDVFYPGGYISLPDTGEGNISGEQKGYIANREKLGDVRLKSILEDGGTLKRNTRISLTCRDVEQIISVRSVFK